MNRQLHERGIAVRKKVLGDEHVEKSVKATNDFNRPFHDFVTEYCWGVVWGRPGLTLNTRSIINLAMLSALNKPHELKLHIRGALRNGVTRDEIREVFMQVAVYCGVPAGVESFRCAQEVFAEIDGNPPTA